MPPRSPFPMFSTGSDSRAALLQGLMIGVIVVGTLYIAREVLLPLALAILLSFVLTPLLLRPRVPAGLGLLGDHLYDLPQLIHAGLPRCGARPGPVWQGRARSTGGCP